MTNVNNAQTIKELVKAGNLQVGFDEVPNKLANAIVPVIETNPRLLRVGNIHRFNVATNALSATIYTTPANQDFYLTSIQCNYIKDASATSLASWVDAIIGGFRTRLIGFTTLTTTAGTDSSSISFPVPILIDRNTTILVNNNTNVGAVSCHACITGYTVETNQ